jgi:hypothetical protein
MSTSPAAAPAAEHHSRHATLKLSNGPTGQVLTATVPSNITDEDFAVVGRSALGLIRRLTNCNCMSGRISFVVEDNFADVIRVELNPQPLPPHQ